VDCDDWRPEISAHLDGEVGTTGPVEVEAHLRSCPGCRAFAVAVARLEERITAAAVAPPSRSAELLGAMAEVRRAGRRRHQLARVALLAVAVVQLALALPALVLGEGHGVATHLARHLGAWDVALAVGFLVAVAQPARAAGLVPLAAALAACMVTAAVLDVVTGAASLFDESLHAVELLGLVLLWVLSRSTPPPEGVRRPVWAVAR
jgi:predicted anti-sigma-YlaC factor YlaD